MERKTKTIFRALFPPPLPMKTRILTFIFVLFAASFSLAQGGKTAGILLDQPAGRVPDLESSFALEVSAQLNGVTVKPFFTQDSDEKLQVIGELPDALWIHQGDEADAVGPLYSPEWTEAIQKYVAGATADKPRVVLLTGGAVRMLQTLGFADVTAPPMTIMNDRYQVGLIPTDGGQNALWNGLTSDRDVFWFTNAVYQAFQKCDLVPKDGTEILVAADVPGGPHLPLFLVKRGNCLFFVLPWYFSQLYDHAAEPFRVNVETFLKNVLTWDFTPENLEALTTHVDPKIVQRNTFLKGIDSLGNMMAGYKEKTGKAYPNEEEFLKKLNELRNAQEPDLAALEVLKRDILLTHPDINFDRILFVKRRGSNLNLPQNYNSNCVLPKTIPAGLSLPRNSTSNSSLPKENYGNTICELNIRTGAQRTLYTPPNDFWVGDLELHFDADRVLFSMPSPTLTDSRWRIWELPLTEGQTPAEPKLMETIEADDVDNYDACYLPDGGLCFCSTACFTGVPCINGSGHVCNLYRKAPDGKISQLTIEQDHDWNPVLLPNGRILYLRWEYSDLPHGFSRIMMHANPDGTNQTEYYGSGSYYPNTMFYARPIPGTSRFSAIISGHHEIPRVGDLVIFDPSKGRKEAEGAVQRIPGAGKPVLPIRLDFPIAQTWPKFSQPFPISDTLFLAACQFNAGSPWSIYLVDTYDNMLEIARPEKDEAGNIYTFQEPTPIRKTECPPVRPDRTNWERSDCDVFIADIYYGQGLPNVPRGTVKALRLFTYEFAYQGMGAEPHSVGLDGPWDPKRVIGVVPVYPDGSASFRMPANTPVAFQALDAEGREIQLMRSWTTAMPGEQVSCTGCHEEQNSVVPTMPSPMASRKPPVDVIPEFGVGAGAFEKVRGFSFQHEIQPILEKHCTVCHDEDSKSEQKSDISFRNGPPVPAFDSTSGYNTQSRFSPSYYNLRRYVRTPTKESQMPVLKPYEFHVESTLLGQILRQGHFGVQLSADDWARLNTWIDLNCPYYGSWGESRNYAIAPQVKHQFERRKALRLLYTAATGTDADDPVEFPVAPALGEAPKPPHKDHFVERTQPTAEPIAASAIPAESVETLEIAPGVTLNLVKVPGQSWKIGQFEVTNEQFSAFDPKHNTGVEYGDFIHFSPNEAGWLLSRKQQPVARISIAEAEAFCEWLSAKTGRKFSLPTAEEWRFAALAGKPDEKDFWFGDLNADYARFENLSDLQNQLINPRSWKGRIDALPPWRIADGNVNDRCRVSALVGSYSANPWGLYDVHGNVSEWTSSKTPTGESIALGGSWYTPSRYSGVQSERHFSAGQETFDVGFRVKCE